MEEKWINLKKMVKWDRKVRTFRLNWSVKKHAIIISGKIETGQKSLEKSKSLSRRKSTDSWKLSTKKRNWFFQKA